MAETDAERDHTVKIVLRRPELAPFARYRYRFLVRGEASRTGHFRTLPSYLGVDRVLDALLEIGRYLNLVTTK